MSEMKLWLLNRIGDTDYDTHAGFVVRAPDEAAARCEVLASVVRPGGLGFDRRQKPPYCNEPEWGDPELTTCVELVAAGDPGVVLYDSRPG